MAAIQFCDVAKGKQAKRQALIPADWLATDDAIAKAKAAAQGKPNWPLLLPDIVLTEEQRTITGASAAQLLVRIHAGQWSARQVADAFCRRAALAQQCTNCLTEILFDEALERAQQLDDYYAQHGKPAGPLAGLPISIKDNFNIKGVDSTLGFVTWANDPQMSESLLIRILREQGVVLYCKTNVPTAMMIPETVNNVWGRTSNPHNQDFTPGGSSGGEASLLTMRGAPLGVGTDIGGSIRIPGAMCGLFALKPSFGRFPTMGARSGMPGQESVASINGPWVYSKEGDGLSPDLESLSVFASAVVNWQPWRLDPKCVPMPWNPPTEASLPRKGLVFGLLRDDAFVHPAPPIARALETTRKALVAAGHTVLELPAKDFAFMQGARILLDFFTADGRQGILDLMRKGDEAEKWVPGLGKPSEPKTVGETWTVQAERWSWGARIFEIWESMKGPDGRVMDAILSPAAAVPGAQHDGFGIYVGYTGVWNVLDVTAGVLPVTHVDAIKYPEDQHQPQPPPPGFFGDIDQDTWRRYDAQKAHGLPVNIQVVGRRLEEEKVLALMQRITEVL